MDNLTPLLVINNASDTDSTSLTYNFELALDPDFLNIAIYEIGIFGGEGITTWQVPLELMDNTLYYWRAQADDWFIEGPWMTPARFLVNTANDAPGAPVIVSPVEDSEIITLSADIVALNSADPDHDTLNYLFEIDTVNTFDSSDLIQSGNIPEGEGTTLWHIEGLKDNTFYYIRTKASDGLAESQWSEVIKFFVNTMNEPPTTPVLANPSDGAGVNTFNPVLSVHNSTDTDGDILTYEFELYGDAAMTNLISKASEAPQITFWTVPVTLTENHLYFWRARAYDGELNSEWMPLASFIVNTANDAPGAPVLHGPANGSSLDTLNPALSVHNASDPDSDILTYDFELYLDGVLTDAPAGIPEDNSGITTVAVQKALSDNKTYEWRARAYDGDRFGAWMDMAGFSVHLPVNNITATINFDPDTLNQKSAGKWVTVYIELPSGYNVNDINIASVYLNGTVKAESWPYAIGAVDKDGIPDLMVKFRRDNVIAILPDGNNIMVKLTGTVGTTTFEGIDLISVIH